MDVEVIGVREIDTAELQRLQKQLVGLWGSQIANKINVAAQKVKLGTWMAMNKFTTIIDKATEKKVVDVFEKGKKISAGVLVGTALLSAVALPALATVVPLAAGATLAGYLGAKATEAVHGINDKAYWATMDKVGDARLRRSFAETNQVMTETKYERIQEEYAQEKAKINQQREAQREEKREEARKQWEAFKEETRENWQDFKLDVLASWEMSKEEFTKLKRDAKDKVSSIVDATKTKVINTVNDAKAKTEEAINKAKSAIEDVKASITNKIDQINQHREEVKTRIEEKMAQKQAQREEMRRTQEEARQQRVEAKRKEAERRAEERQEAKLERQREISGRCMNFISCTSAFVGKEFLAKHLLTQEDRQKYERNQQNLTALKQERANQINEALGTSYTAKDIMKMSDKKLARIETMVMANQRVNEKTEGATV